MHMRERFGIIDYSHLQPREIDPETQRVVTEIGRLRTNWAGEHARAAGERFRRKATLSQETGAAAELIGSFIEDQRDYLIELVRDNRGNIVGYGFYSGALAGEPRNEAVLEDIYIAPKFRQIGIMSQLVERLCMAARNAGYTSIKAQPENAVSEQALLHRGFQVRSQYLPGVSTLVRHL